MKKAIWFAGIFVIAFMLIVGGYLLFFQDKSSKMPEGTFVRMEMPKRTYQGGQGNGSGHTRICMEGMWNAWQKSA